MGNGLDSPGGARQPRTVAALFVDTQRGPYAAMPGVECWGVERDARTYPGPHPVVAHPPCERWGKFWRGGLQAGKTLATGTVVPVHRLGDDGGCFAAALDAVRCWGGVLEHPAGSNAWAAHGLAAPLAEGWHAADFLGGWTCQIEQGHWGHPARKATWLYANGVDLPSLVWGQSAAMGRITCGHRQGKSMLRPGQFAVRKSERHLTPPAFAELLVAIARSAKVGAGGAQ